MVDDMNMQRTSFSVCRPVSLWNKLLKTDFKQLFHALGSAAIHGAAGNWAGLAKSALDGLSAFNFQKDPPQMAWLLINRALTRALFELVEEVSPSLRGPAYDVDALCDALDLSFEQSEARIDADFFQHPELVSVVRQIKAPLGEFLCSLGLSSSEAAGIASRIDWYFVFALQEEWRKRPQDYSCIAEVFTGPWVPATERAAAWLSYRARLIRQANELLFGDAIGLQSVYVLLRAWHYDRSQDTSERKLSSRMRQFPFRIKL